MSTRFRLAAGAVLLVGLVQSGAAVGSAQAPSTYRYVLSSGPFGLPANAHSVDWKALNDSPVSQSVRVTVYNVRIGMAKTPVVPPGPRTYTLQPSFATHNANGVGAGKPFSVGGTYEVVVELNDRRVLPIVEVWSNSANTVIAGTRLSPQDFTEIP